MYNMDIYHDAYTRQTESPKTWTSGQVIGEGSYGSVQKCQVKDTGHWRAVKTVNRALVKNTDQFMEEMAIMKLLDHPNIVRLYETFEDARFVYLVLELCTGGELFDRIVADGKFTEQSAAIAVQQMLRAINYMHQNYIMHRDLKPENWLLVSRPAGLPGSDPACLTRVGGPVIMQASGRGSPALGRRQPGRWLLERRASLRSGRSGWSGRSGQPPSRPAAQLPSRPAAQPPSRPG